MCLLTVIKPLVMLVLIPSKLTECSLAKTIDSMLTLITVKGEVLLGQILIQTEGIIQITSITGVLSIV